MDGKCLCVSILKELNEKMCLQKMLKIIFSFARARFSPQLLQSLVLPAAANDFPNETAVFMGLSHTVMSGLQNVQRVHESLPVTNSKKTSRHFCLV